MRAYLKMAPVALLLLLGLAAAYYMEEHGHVVTGMNNQVVWGLPHVFAFFLIVAASGALNVASIASVFGEKAYKPLAPLSALLSVALLAGGLMILVLDLGRPERLFVAMTNFNFRSVFAWNMQLYTGLFAIGALYLWVLLEGRMNRFTRPVGTLAFAWRVILTTATGSVLGFLVSRAAFGTAVMAPLFIALSLAWGLAAFWVAHVALAPQPIDTAFATRVGRLLGLFVIVVLWLVAVYHGSNLYWARQDAFERFILVEGRPYAPLFWGGFFLGGCAAPLALVYHPRLAGPRATLCASALVLLGALAFVYVLLVGAQAWPLEIFPGYTARSDFGDGVIDAYAPSLPELLLGVGGIALASILTFAGTRLFPILPRGAH